MSDYRWHDDDYRTDDRRSWTERAGDEVRSWFGDDEARMRRGNDERQDRHPYGGERSWRDQGEGSYERASGSSGWRGGRDFGGYEGSRWGGGERSRDEDQGYGDYGYGDYGRRDLRRDYRQSFGDYGRGDRQQYGRGGQYGSTSYDRGQLRRSYSDWTPGGASGARDWENRGDQWGWSGRATEPQPASGRSSWDRTSESYAGRGPKGYRRSDERIRDEVSDVLTADPQVDATEIIVQVQNGLVTLSGSVATREQKRRAEDVSERVSGVSDVTNNLKVNKQEDRHDVSRLVTPSVTEPNR